MKMQKMYLNRWAIPVMALCLNACIHMKDMAFTSERVQITGTLSKEILLNGSTIWKINPTKESISSIRDNLLRGSVDLKGVFLVSSDSPLANSYHRKYPIFVLQGLRAETKVTARGNLTVGQVISAQNHDITRGIILCIKRRDLIINPCMP